MRLCFRVVNAEEQVTGPCEGSTFGSVGNCPAATAGAVPLPFGRRWTREALQAGAPPAQGTRVRILGVSWSFTLVSDGSLFSVIYWLKSSHGTDNFFCCVVP